MYTCIASTFNTNTRRLLMLEFNNITCDTNIYSFFFFFYLFESCLPCRRLSIIQIMYKIFSKREKGGKKGTRKSSVYKSR